MTRTLYNLGHKNRKKSYPINKETFLQDSINFLFSLSSEEQESSIGEVFNAFGSVSFIGIFLKNTQSIPVAVLTSSMNTFLNKVFTDNVSVYYRKKSIVYGDKIRANLKKSMENYLFRDRDEFGLSIVKFFSDLTSE